MLLFISGTGWGSVTQKIASYIAFKATLKCLGKGLTGSYMHM